MPESRPSRLLVFTGDGAARRVSARHGRHVELVLRWHANPYRAGRRSPSDAEIMRVADAQYYVDPWPFGALVDD